MKITVAEHAGFCFGVKKAVSIAMNCKAGTAAVLGEIIHNNRVIEELKAAGIRSVSSLEEILPQEKVIIRSHGESKAIFDKAEKMGIELIDATCPFVKKIHKIVEKYYLQGYSIIIIGEAAHPEVIGINGWCDNTAIIINNTADAENLNYPQKTCVVVQTTFNYEKYSEIVKIIKGKCIKTLEIFNTICYTTSMQQKEAAELAANSDAMVVVGDRKSSNTMKLYEVCKSKCANVFLISKPNEVSSCDIKKFIRTGVVAGASAPDGLIMEVLNSMTEQANANEKEMTMDDVMGSINDIKIGQTVNATIVSADETGVVVGLGAKKDGFIPKEEAVLSGEYNPADFVIGTDVKVKVMSYDKEKFIVSKKAVDSLKDVELKIEAIKSGAEFTLPLSAGKGGLFGRIGNYKVFVPSSHIRLGFVPQEKLKEYENQTLRLRVINVVEETNENGSMKRELIASQKVILEEERAQKKAAAEAEKAKREEEFFSTVEVGQVVTGRVQRMTEFGAFVRVNGFDCLAHITDLSWTRIEKPSDVLELNKDYNFIVLKADPETKKVSLGYKQLQPKPWELAAEKYPVGSVVKGKIVRIAPFGAFVEIEKGIDALVHVSEISHNWIGSVTEAVNVGDEVEAMVLSVDPVAKKMNISIKALQPEPEVKIVPEKEEKVEKSEKKEKKVTERPRRKKEDDDLPKEYIGGNSGASIKDLLGGLELNFEQESSEEEKTEKPKKSKKVKEAAEQAETSEE